MAKKSDEYKELINIIIDALDNKGWKLAACEDPKDKDGTVGIVLGTEDYIDFMMTVIKKMEKEKKSKIKKVG